MGWQDLACAILACALILGTPSRAVRVESRPCYAPLVNEVSVYNFTVADLHQTRNVSLSEFKGKILLIVNVATYWGFTWKYVPMKALKNTYMDSDFEILAFPSNQFGLQEPGANATEILNGIKYVRPGSGYEPNFMMFKKIEVNGEKEEPLYTYLKSHCPETRDYFSGVNKLFYSPLNVRDIRWNFEAFLINRQGKPVMRYDPNTHPNNYAKDIDYLLSLDATTS